MSEDSNFIGKKKPQGFGSDEHRCGVDFFGTLGKGMLPKENLETLGNSSGLTPLSTDVLKNSSGLSPLRPFVKNHKKEVLE